MRPAPLIVMGIAVALRMPFLDAPELDWDEGVYWESLRALAQGHSLFASVYSSQPPAFLLGLLPFFQALGGGIAAARTGCLVFWAAGLAGGWYLGERLGGTGSGLLAVVALAAPTFFFRESVALQAEAPALGLGLVALALAAARPQGRSAPALAAAAGVILASAVLAKLLALPAVPAVFVAASLDADGRGRRLGALAVGGAAGAAAWLLPFAGSWPQLYHQVVGFHVTAHATGLSDTPGLLHAAFDLSPVAVAGGLGVVYGLRRWSPLALVSGAWLLAALALAALQHPLWPHHLAAAGIPLALATGSLTGLAPTLGGGRAWLGPAAALALLAAGAVLFALQVPDGAGQRAAAAQLRAMVPPGRLLVTDDQFVAALAGRDVPPALVDTSAVRIASHDLTEAEVDRAIARPEVAGVLVGTHRLEQLPGLQQVEATMDGPIDLGQNHYLFLSRHSGQG